MLNRGDFLQGRTQKSKIRARAACKIREFSHDRAIFVVIDEAELFFASCRLLKFTLTEGGVWAKLCLWTLK